MINLFIQLEKENTRDVRYYAVGKYVNDKFTGIAHGYEGGGVYSERYIYKNKFLPIYDEDNGSYEWDDSTEAFSLLVGKNDYLRLEREVEKYLDFDTDKLHWVIDEKNIYLFDNNVCSIGFKGNPPAYGNTSWNEAELKEWDLEEIKSELKKKSRLELTSYCDDYIEHHKAFPMDMLLLIDTPFETKIEFVEYESILGDLFSKLADKIYNYYWIDPSFYDDDEHASGLCEIAIWPLESLRLNAYSRLSYEDYDHCCDEDKYGLEIGVFTYDKTCEESIECTWFETSEKREAYISSLDKKYKDISSLFLCFYKLDSYPNDAIFNIVKQDGGEAEVYRSELLARNEMSFFNASKIYSIKDSGELDLKNPVEVKEQGN